MDKTNLEILYDSIKGFEELGVSLPKETQAKLDELEEQLITSEVLPALTKDIEPRLSKIQRELVLVVEYKPGEPISVALSRKTNITELLKAKRLEIDPQVEHKTYQQKPKPLSRIAPRTGLCIYRKDGTILQERDAATTFTKAIIEADILRVRSLGLRLCGMNIVSTTIDSKYGKAQREVGRGLYVLTHSNTNCKKQILEKINQMLNMEWTIKIV